MKKILLIILSLLFLVSYFDNATIKNQVILIPKKYNKTRIKTVMEGNEIQPIVFEKIIQTEYKSKSFKIDIDSMIAGGALLSLSCFCLTVETGTENVIPKITGLIFGMHGARLIIKSIKF